MLRRRKRKTSSGGRLRRKRSYEKRQMFKTERRKLKED